MAVETGWLEVIDLDGERMPPVPLEKSRYYSSVAAWVSNKDFAGFKDRLMLKYSLISVILRTFFLKVSIIHMYLPGMVDANDSWGNIKGRFCQGLADADSTLEWEFQGSLIPRQDALNV